MHVKYLKYNMKPEPHDFYPQMGQALADLVDDDFVQAWMYAEIDEEQTSIDVYFQNPQGPIVMLDLAHEQLASLYADLQAFWEDSRADGEAPWHTLTFDLKASGHFETAFGYQEIHDLSEFLNRRKAWEKEQFGPRKIKVL